jgi:hypothetical protein
VDQAEALQAMVQFVDLIETFDIETIKQQKTHLLRQSSFFFKSKLMRSKVTERMGTEVKSKSNFVSFLGDSERYGNSGNKKSETTDRVSYDPALFAHQLEEVCKDMEYFHYEDDFEQALDKISHQLKE